MPEVARKIDECVDVLCDQGCERVGGFIIALRGGEDFPGVADLNTVERLQVLENLLEIMAVYDSRGDD